MKDFNWNNKPYNRDIEIKETIWSFFGFGCFVGMLVFSLYLYY